MENYLTAEQAREISENSKYDTTESVQKHIKSMADCGNRFAYAKMSEAQIVLFESLGYTVTPVAGSKYEINW